MESTNYKATNKFKKLDLIDRNWVIIYMKEINFVKLIYLKSCSWSKVILNSMRKNNTIMCVWMNVGKKKIWMKLIYKLILKWYGLYLDDLL